MRVMLLGWAAGGWGQSVVSRGQEGWILDEERRGGNVSIPGLAQWGEEVTGWWLDCWGQGQLRHLEWPARVGIPKTARS